MAWTLGIVPTPQDTLALLITSLTLPGLCPNPSTDKWQQPPPPIFTKSHRRQLPRTTKLCQHQHQLWLPTSIKPHLRCRHPPSHGLRTPPLLRRSHSTAQFHFSGCSHISKAVPSACSLTTASGCAQWPMNTCTQAMRRWWATSCAYQTTNAYPTTVLGVESRQV